jgi:hypothetical protein
VIVYGLADYKLAEIIEFYPSREAAEEALRQVVHDEPDWAEVLDVEGVEFDSGRN